MSQAVWFGEDAPFPQGANENSVFAYSLNLISKNQCPKYNSCIVMICGRGAFTELKIIAQKAIRASLSFGNFRFTHLMPSWPQAFHLVTRQECFLSFVKVPTLPGSQAPRGAVWCTPVARFEVSNTSDWRSMQTVNCRAVFWGSFPFLSKFDLLVWKYNSISVYWVNKTVRFVSLSGKCGGKIFVERG